MLKKKQGGEIFIMELSWLGKALFIDAVHVMEIGEQFCVDLHACKTENCCPAFVVCVVLAAARPGLLFSERVQAQGLLSAKSDLVKFGET